MTPVIQLLERRNDDTKVILLWERKGILQKKIDEKHFHYAFQNVYSVLQKVLYCSLCPMSMELILNE